MEKLQLAPSASDGIVLPEDDFLLYKDAHDKTMTLLNCWMDNRVVAEGELRRIADELDQWERGTNISSVVGGIAGIGGGIAVICGVILMPPVAVAGLVLGGAAAASNTVTGLLKQQNLKKSISAAMEMLENDRKMTETLANSIASVEETKELILSSNNIEMRGKCTATSLKWEDVISSSRAEAVSLAGGAIRLVLKDSATLRSAMAKCAIHAITAVVIAIDALTVALSVKVYAMKKTRLRIPAGLYKSMCWQFTKKVKYVAHSEVTEKLKQIFPHC